MQFCLSLAVPTGFVDSNRQIAHLRLKGSRKCTLMRFLLETNFRKSGFRKKNPERTCDFTGHYLSQLRFRIAKKLGLRLTFFAVAGGRCLVDQLVEYQCIIDPKPDFYFELCCNPKLDFNPRSDLGRQSLIPNQTVFQNQILNPNQILCRP